MIVFLSNKIYNIFINNVKTFPMIVSLKSNDDTIYYFEVIGQLSETPYVLIDKSYFQEGEQVSIQLCSIQSVKLLRLVALNPVCCGIENGLDIIHSVSSFRSILQKNEVIKTKIPYIVNNNGTCEVKEDVAEFQIADMEPDDVCYFKPGDNINIDLSNIFFKKMEEGEITTITPLNEFNVNKIMKELDDYEIMKSSTPVMDGNDVTKCQYCDKMINTKQLKMHEIQCKKRTTKCAICQKAIRKDKEQQHMDKHMFVHCPFCNKLSEKDIIIKHTLTCDKRIIQCDICKMYVCSDDINNHMDVCLNFNTTNDISSFIKQKVNNDKLFHDDNIDLVNEQLRNIEYDDIDDINGIDEITVVRDGRFYNKRFNSHNKYHITSRHYNFEAHDDNETNDLYHEDADDNFIDSSSSNSSNNTEFYDDVD